MSPQKCYRKAVDKAHLPLPHHTGSKVATSSSNPVGPGRELVNYFQAQVERLRVHVFCLVNGRKIASVAILLCHLRPITFSKIKVLVEQVLPTNRVYARVDSCAAVPTDCLPGGYSYD